MLLPWSPAGAPFHLSRRAGKSQPRPRLADRPRAPRLLEAVAARAAVEAATRPFVHPTGALLVPVPVTQRSPVDGCTPANAQGAPIAEPRGCRRAAWRRP